MDLLTISGTTGDSVYVFLHPHGGGFTAPHTYTGHAYFESPDADNTARLLIKMTVVPSTGGPATSRPGRAAAA